jgi:hypothetical protein
METTILIAHDLKKFDLSYNSIEGCSEGCLSESRTQDEIVFTTSRG